VQNDPASRGGSRFIHEGLRAGAELLISAPLNNFELNEHAERTVLIAGGIGVTPIWCMAQRLAELGRPFEVVFAARSRKRAAFLDGMIALLGKDSPNLTLHFDDETGGKPLDMAAIVRGAKPDAHLYCCGPLPMLAAFEAATTERAEETVHVEYFSAKEAIDTAGGFEVVLARAGKSVTIPPGATILDTLLENGVNVPYSCLEGVCGTCEVSVVEGTPDHRDAVLSAKERASNRTMMVCCSGSKSPKLVLDL
jgi:ferredoxin-NADP reductase